MFKPVSAFAKPAVQQTAVIVANTNAAVEAVFQRNMERLVNSGVDVDKLRNHVVSVAGGFNPRDSVALSKLGSDAGVRVTSYSDKLLQQVRSNDIDGMGDKLNGVVMLAKGINVNDIVNGKPKIPLIGGLIAKFSMGKEQILGKYDSLAKQIEKLVGEVKVTQTKLQTRIESLEQMYNFNVEEYYNLEQNVLVGEVKQEELAQELASMKASPNAADPIEAQQISDLQDVINRLGMRVHNLKTMQMVAIQTAPMIRMIQSNNTILIDKFQNLNELTIPSWKKQFTLAISLLEQKKAVELATAIDDTTNDLMKRNADLLKQNTIATAKANQRSVVDVETLQYVQDALISTIEEVKQIQTEGEQKRVDAIKSMEAMKTQLIQKANM